MKIKTDTNLLDLRSCALNAMLTVDTVYKKPVLLLCHISVSCLSDEMLVLIF